VHLTAAKQIKPYLGGAGFLSFATCGHAFDTCQPLPLTGAAIYLPASRLVFAGGCAILPCLLAPPQASRQVSPAKCAILSSCFLQILLAQAIWSWGIEVWRPVIICNSIGQSLQQNMIVSSYVHAEQSDVASKLTRWRLRCALRNCHCILPPKCDC